MIVDTHVHYLETAGGGRPHTDDPLLPPLSVDGVADAAAAAGVDKVVQVTPSTMGWDNAYSFAGARARPDRVLGVFGRVDPFSPGLASRLCDYWAQPGALGVRFTMFRGPEVGWLVDRALDLFLEEAAAQDVPVALFAPYQASVMLETALRHPDVRFIADHTLMLREPLPRKPWATFRDWNALIALAYRPNVWTKLSYFPEAACDDEPDPFMGAQAYLRRLYEQVGAERLIWGSNFPVSLAACPYARSLAFIRDECGFIPRSDRDAILGGNFLASFCRR